MTGGTMEQQNGMRKRILANAGDMELLNKLEAMQPSDVQSLLLEIFGKLAGKASPAGLMREYERNKYVKPSALDAVAYLRLELDLASMAGEMGITPVLLSPAGLMGSCSAIASVSQNKVLSAIKGTEILADPTNMLAFDIAHRIRRGEWSNTGAPIHLCAASRVVRSQPFSGPALFSHFGIFCLVSSGRDTGSYACEHSMLQMHLAFYSRFFQERTGRRMEVVLKKRGGYADGEGFLLRTLSYLQKTLPHVPLEADRTEADNSYYLGTNFKLKLPVDGRLSEIGDGGFVDWTQKLLGNKKERLLISGIGLDRLLALPSK